MIRSREVPSASKSLTVIAFVLAIAALYLGRSIFIPLALSLVLSFLLTPFVIVLEKIRCGRVPAVFAVIALSLVLIGLATWGVAGQMVEIMVHLPDYKTNLDAKIKSLHGSKAGSLSKATATVQELNRELAAVPAQVTGTAQARESGSSRTTHPLAVQVSPPASNLMQDLAALLGPLTGPLETAVIVVIFTTFMLVKREDLRNRAIRLAGRGQLSVMTQAFDDAGRRLSRFLLAQFMVNAVYGSLFGLGLYFIGVPHPLLWGLVAGLLRFVPYVGTFIAAALPIAVAIAVFPGWRQAGIAFGVFVVLELIVSNVVEPLLYGAHTGISALAILVAAVFWATLWGPVGLILSTPLTVCLVVLGRYFPQLEFLEVVLGDEPALPPEQLFYQRLLAMDQEEARSIAEAHLKDNQVVDLYETIVIPALMLAEQDFSMNALDDELRKFVVRSTREVVEDIGDSLDDNSDNLVVDSNGSVSGKEIDFKNPDTKIVCLPVRGGSDELVATMLAQLLRNAGYQAQALRSAPTDEMVAEVSRRQATVVCVSCLPPFAAVSARSLCKRLKGRLPDLQVMVGLWHLEGGSEAARERMGVACPDLVVTKLGDALTEIRQLNAPSSREKVAEEARSL